VNLLSVVLTQEQELLRGTIRDFSRDEISAVAAKIDSESKVPEDLFQKLSGMGLYGITIPSEYGGAEADYLSLLLAVEELSKVSGSLGARISFNGVVCEALKASTNEELKGSIFRKIVGGMLPAFSVDPKSTIEWKQNQNGEWILDGSSDYVLNADTAGIFLLLAKSKEGKKILVCFSKEDAQDHLTVREPQKLMGLRGSGTSKISVRALQLEKSFIAFDTVNVSVGLDRLYIAARLAVSSQALGIGQAALDEEIRYANERAQFNTKIGRFYAVQDFIASDEVSLDTARSLTQGVASMSLTEDSANRKSCVAKIAASNAAVQSARHSIRTHGGYGFIHDYPVERYLRDARVTQIYLEPNEVLKAKIAEDLLR
jgi:alkylation response protein AidB-like acyl-CoA dehydrogenase